MPPDTAPASDSLSVSDLTVNSLFPRRGGRWAGRWTSAGGRTVYGLYDPADASVTVIEPADDPALPGLGQWLPGGRLVSYRPTRRAVVRVPDPPRYVKVVRPRRVASIVHAHEVVERARAGAGPAFPAFPPLLEWSEADGVVVVGEVAGCSMRDLLRTDAPRVVAHVAEALAAFHAAPAAGAGLPPAGGRSLTDWVEMVAPFLDPVARRRYGTVLENLPPAPSPAPHGARLVHGDLHDRNLVLGADGVAFLDLDSLGAGDPALDVGNLAAHVVLRIVQTRGDPAAGRRLAEPLTASGPPGVEASRARALFRLACVYAARPRWRHVCEPLLSEAARHPS